MSKSQRWPHCRSPLPCPARPYSTGRSGIIFLLVIHGFTCALLAENAEARRAYVGRQLHGFAASRRSVATGAGGNASCDEVDTHTYNAAFRGGGGGGADSTARTRAVGQGPRPHVGPSATPISVAPSAAAVEAVHRAAAGAAPADAPPPPAPHPGRGAAVRRLRAGFAPVALSPSDRRADGAATPTEDPVVSTRIPGLGRGGVWRHMRSHCGLQVN